MEYNKAMAILVTGGMGFIGWHTINELSNNFPNERILCLDNLSLSELKALPKNAEFIKGDIRDVKLVSQLVAEADKGVIHLAADSRVLPSLHNPDLVIESIETNVKGTANILVSMVKYQRGATMVYAGSSTAYGDHATPQSEDLLPRVQSPYSATKLSGENLIKSFVETFGLKATVLRYFQVYGQGQPKSGPYALVTGIFLDQAHKGLPLTIEGTGEQRRDFVHVKDVARANRCALTFNSKGNPINIGTGISYSINELADMISQNQVTLPPRKIDLPATLADTAIAKAQLGWNSQISLLDGIQEMLVN